MRGKRNNNRRGDMERNIAAFLEAYERLGTEIEAVEAIGLSRWAVKNWRLRVPGFNERYDAATARVVERVGPVAERELIKRAIEGERTLVIDRGQPVEVWVNPDGEIVPAPKDPEKPGDLKKKVYWEVKKSDALLVKLLQRLYPELYADKQKVDHTSGGKPFKVIGGINEDAL